MINTTMKKLMVILFATVLLTACSVKNPALDLGKRCMVKGDQIIYSYVWVYDTESGNKATKEICNQIDQ